MMVKKVIRNALVLAAGRGSRLMPLTKNLPKCLVCIGKRPILFYQLQALEAQGVRNVIFVVGYLGRKIEKYVRQNFFHFSCQFIYNNEYSKTNDIYSLYLALKSLKKSTLVLDSDVLFQPGIIAELLRLPEEVSAVCLRRVPCAEEEMKVKLNLDGMVVGLSKHLLPEETYGEFIGISVFSRAFLKSLFRAIKIILVGKGPHLDREVAIESVISRTKHVLHHLDVTHYAAIEIDSPEDLEMAERQVLPKII